MTDLLTVPPVSKPITRLLLPSRLEHQRGQRRQHHVRVEYVSLDHMSNRVLHLLDAPLEVNALAGCAQHHAQSIGTLPGTDGPSRCSSIEWNVIGHDYVMAAITISSSTFLSAHLCKRQAAVKSKQAARLVPKRGAAVRLNGKRKLRTCVWIELGLPVQ